MGFRTVLVNSRAKLEFRLNYLIVRGDKEKKIFVDEINTLIIQSTAVSLTAALLCELMKNNVKVIFCDEKSNPISELLPYYGAHNTTKRYHEQINWKQETKDKVWKVIIGKKISEQARHLEDLGFEQQSALLNEYVSQIQDGDVTNREGHAAKVYFNSILGGDSRQSDIFFNACLNYGYSILLSAFNREITASGYLTQLGIWHDNEFNEFNLACDLMEPFRVLVDRKSLTLSEHDDRFKKKLIALLNCKTIMNGKATTLDIAIRQYTRSVFHALNENDVTQIVFPEKIFPNDE